MYVSIITGLFMALVVLELLAYAMVDSIISGSSLRASFAFRRIVRALFLIQFVVFNCLYSFAKPVYVFQLVLQIAGNVLSFCYFFFDYFYLSQKKRSYILWMQKNVYREPVKKVFKMIPANGVAFEKKKSVPQQLLSVVDAGHGKGLCIYLPTKDGGLLFQPKKPMNEPTLMFYAEKIEMDSDGLPAPCFFNGDLPPEAIKEYQFGPESKIYLWLRNKLFSERGKSIILIATIALFTIGLSIMVLVSDALGINLVNDWLFAKL